VYDTGWQNVIVQNKTLQMRTVETESGLGNKSYQVRDQIKFQQKWLKSGLESKSGLEYYKSVIYRHISHRN